MFRFLLRNIEITVCGRIFQGERTLVLRRCSMTARLRTVADLPSAWTISHTGLMCGRSLQCKMTTESDWYIIYFSHFVRYKQFLQYAYVVISSFAVYKLAVIGFRRAGTSTSQPTDEHCTDSCVGRTNNTSTEGRRTLCRRPDTYPTPQVRLPFLATTVPSVALCAYM